MNEAYAQPDTTPVPGSRRHLTFRYLLLIVLPILAGLLLVNGYSANSGAALVAKAGAHGWLANLESAPAKFMLQLLLVLACAKAAGSFVRRLGQPAVIGEMLAGILLGPSLFGLLAPDMHAWIFPPASLGGFSLVTQLGVLVFMFAAGAEFDLSSLDGQRSRALLISHAGIALPFLLGLLLALPLFRHYAPAGVAFSSFALFLGIALSITAFPVLLRILEDRGYSARPIGRVAVACAALTDATAWAMLGIIVAAVESSSALEVLARLAVALLLAWLCIGKLRAKIATRVVEERHESRWMLLMALALFAGSLASEAIGLHALFGAFVAGMAFSSNPRLCRLVAERIEPFAAVLLVPLFFATTGLRTRIDLLTGTDWALCGAIVVVATVGKLGGTVLAARMTGVERVDAWRLGALMNTRGLMELIVLGIGYDLGLIDRKLFAILVLVAITTTVMTGRILGSIDKRHPQPPLAS